MNTSEILMAYRKMGKNVMTPNVKAYRMTSDDRIVELSTGTGIDGKQIWGVSEFEVNQSGKLETTRRGEMHITARSARIHFNSLI